MSENPESKINTKLNDTSVSFHTQIDELRTIAEENLRYSKTLHESAQRNGDVTTANVYQLLQQNVELTERIIQLSQSLHRWVMFQWVWFWIKVVLIGVPLILGAIFLPPLLRDLTEQYRNALNVLGFF